MLMSCPSWEDSDPAGSCGKGEPCAIDSPSLEWDFPFTELWECRDGVDFV